MDRIAQNIFKAVHEGKWLSIEYKNQRDQITNYWIAIHGIDVRKRSLSVEGFHLMMHTVERYDFIYIDSILSAAVDRRTACGGHRTESGKIRTPFRADCEPEDPQLPDRLQPSGYPALPV